jgi:hypothetical protein
VHGFAATGTTGSCFDFQPTFTQNKLPAAELAFVTLFAIFHFSEFVKRI